MFNENKELHQQLYDLRVRVAADNKDGEIANLLAKVAEYQHRSETFAVELTQTKVENENLQREVHRLSNKMGDLQGNSDGLQLKLKGLESERLTVETNLRKEMQAALNPSKQLLKEN